MLISSSFKAVHMCQLRISVLCRTNSFTLLIKTISYSWYVWLNQNYHVTIFSKIAICSSSGLTTSTPYSRAEMRDLLILYSPMGFKSTFYFHHLWGSLSPLVGNHLPPDNTLAHSSSMSKRRCGIIFLQLWNLPVASFLIFYHHLKPESQIWYSLSLSHTVEFLLYYLGSRYFAKNWGHNEKYIIVFPYQVQFHPSFFPFPMECTFHPHYTL